MKRHLTVLLAGALILGSVVLWLGIPLGWLWLLSKSGRSYFDTLIGAIALSTVTMVLWGWCLHRINKVYLQITQSESRGSGRRPRIPADGLLEVCMTTSVILAIAAMFAWLIIFGGSGQLPAQGAW